jgi:hypothetical protein
MTAANDSAGLKIAVAFFISLSVILTVALYFMYAAYTQADARLQMVQRTNDQSRRALRVLQSQYDELKAQMNKPADAALKSKEK